MMWTFILIFSSCVAAQAASQETKAECERLQGHEFPPVSADAAPSSLVDLKVKLVTVEGRQMLNISWAINIDSSVHLLNSTRITISGEPEIRCRFNPPLAQIKLNQTTQIWFHVLVKASFGFNVIEAANLPLPPLGGGGSSKNVAINVPRLETFPLVPTESAGFPQTEIPPEPTPAGLETKDVMVAVLGSLAGLVMLSSCYLIYRNYGPNVAASLGFQTFPDAVPVPVPVLVVYPAHSSSFQRAVAALAEFLQWHGGCSVALDMWNQGKVAELGPMRWMAEQVKEADRVLIVCPGVETGPDLHSVPEPSVPAAARDLYPLVLNMAAGHAKSAGELEKFWVVQLGERRDGKPAASPPELRTCRTFRLMKDLKKLCGGLHAARRSWRTSDLLLRPGFSYSEKSSEKLKEAVEMLNGNQTSSSKETQPLRSGISNV